MTKLVWVDAWQMQCCGEPFAVGEAVSWRLNAAIDVDWLLAALPPAVAHRISYAEERHDEPPDGHPIGRGSVSAIWAAYSSYRPLNDGLTWHPVPGSAVLRNVARADGNVNGEPEDRFNGYVVELELFSDIV